MSLSFPSISFRPVYAGGRRARKVAAHWRLGMGRGKWIDRCSEAFPDGWAMRIEGEGRLENARALLEGNPGGSRDGFALHMFVAG